MNQQTADKIKEWVAENAIWDAIPDYIEFENFINSLVSEDDKQESCIAPLWPFGKPKPIDPTDARMRQQIIDHATPRSIVYAPKHKVWKKDYTA